MTFTGTGGHRDRMRTALLEEIALSEDIVRKGVEVVPRFRITVPDGEYRILMPPDDMTIHKRGMRFMAKNPFLQNVLELLKSNPSEGAFMAWKQASVAFMAWKQASAFIIAGELKEPDAIAAFAVCSDGCTGIMRLIEREPLSFSEKQWLDENTIDSQLVALLPSADTSIDHETEEDLKRLFGEGGEYQAHKLN